MSDAELNTWWDRGEDENIGGMLKETGNTHWLSPNSGATNESGFTARGGGYRIDWGSFTNIGYSAFFWSSTSRDNLAWIRSLDKDGTYISRSEINKIVGFSVRCVKD